MTEYLRLDEVLEQHARRIGPDLVRDPGQVAATLSRPAAGSVDVEFYPTLAAKSAALLHGFATAQAFVDGNKRMAVYAAGVFLLINGYRLTLDDDSMFQLAMSAAESRADVEAITEVLAGAMVSLDIPDE